MKAFLLALILTLVMVGQVSRAEVHSECPYQGVFQDIPLNDVLKRENICQGLATINDETELEVALEFFFKEVSSKTRPNRHDATQALNNCRPTPQSKVLIIAFEGTGAYEPTIPPTMANFSKCFGGKINPSLKDKVYSKVKEIYRRINSKEPKWSGLQAGIMEELISLKNGNQADWYSFPSEEVEQLAGLEQIKNFSIKQLHDSIKDSVASNPKGIQNARDCITNYMKEAKALGINPEVVIVSHSSGGRSLVKFAEHVKKDTGTPISLAFSIDPVKEAHHAVEEVLPQKIGEPARYLKWKITNGKPEDYPYSAVWTRRNKEKLYSPSNIQEHLNFYQNNDRLGLKIGGDALRFGIHGSPMEGAENKYIDNQGIGGHGDITYDSRVLKAFKEKLTPLLR